LFDQGAIVKIAVIGCGFFAQNQLHAWCDINGVEVVAICDLDPERLAHTASKFGIARAYRDAHDMFKDGGFDVVDIATTVGSHRTLVEMAARAGVHVICQKPFALNLADARAMVDAVNSTGKVLMVHENFRWQSAVRRVIDIVRSGVIGDPFFGRVSFRSGYDVFSGQPYLAEGERFIIEDLGIHALDIARALFGDVAYLSATTKRVNANIRGEDVATILMEHVSGVTSIVDCSYATRRTVEAFPETVLEIDGALGTVRLDLNYQMTIDVGGASRTVDVAPPLLEWAERPWHNIQESVLLIQKHFVDCLEQGDDPETNGHDNVKTFALVEAAYRSAADHITVDMATL
jgi:predicted dehydrogenase